MAGYLLPQELASNFQALLGQFGTVGLVDGLQRGGNGPALFP